jgi:hypothetical protein
MISKVKELELMKIIFIIVLNTFGSNVLLTLKVVDFENVVLTLCIEQGIVKGMLKFF